MSLTWYTESWLEEKKPYLGSDELYRHTLAIPFGETIEVDDEGDRLYRTLVVVIRPWWLCKIALKKKNRVYIRWERAYFKALYEITAPEDSDEYDKAWDAIYSKYNSENKPPEMWE